ncbi:hypothetical protein SAMN06296386_105210 [Lachnospiraceae bacterium]|nr:hypothetical protein SAMN06296386_105210 [Lachnospiraceae bacterium]
MAKSRTIFTFYIILSDYYKIRLSKLCIIANTLIFTGIFRVVHVRFFAGAMEVVRNILRFCVALLTAQAEVLLCTRTRCLVVSAPPPIVRRVPQLGHFALMPRAALKVPSDSAPPRLSYARASVLGCQCVRLA